MTLVAHFLAISFYKGAAALAALPFALRRIGDLSEDQVRVLETCPRSLVDKFLQGPSVPLRAAAANGWGPRSG